jgi:DNA-binding Lrp family transcriptional regulator
MTIGGTEFKITKLAFDEDVRRILLVTCSSPICVKEISKRLDMPITKCYRLVRQMEKRGMLKRHDEEITNIAIYSSNLRSINFRIEQDRLSIDVEFADGGKRAFEFSPRQTVVTT